MKKLLLFSLIALMSLSFVQANTSTYRINHTSVDQMFASAEQLDLATAENMMGFSEASVFLGAQDKDPVIAFILNTFLGTFGIHRAYLGTSGTTIVAYILTMGGCGIVAFVDWIMLLISVVNEESISQYVNNPSFFMW